ncbi:MAG: hypothetical protein AAF203_07370 [Pseudomonadota bacterium]
MKLWFVCSLILLFTGWGHAQIVPFSYWAPKANGNPFDYICTTGTLDTTCNVDTTNAIPNSATISGSGNLVIQSGGQLTSSATGP